MAYSFEKPDELFYIPQSDIEANNATLKGQEAIHCLSVLRYKVGDSIYFTDAQSTLFRGAIISAKKGNAVISIQEASIEKDIHIDSYPTLLIGALKNKDRLEFVVEKAVELGVKEIVIVQTERSERAKIRIDRLENVAIAAMKQSKRLQIPSIIVKDSLINALSAYKNASIVLAHEQETKLTSNAIASILERNPIVCVGPEGGFTDDEIASINVLDTLSIVSLGDWRLRAETAAIALLSMALQARLV